MRLITNEKLAKWVETINLQQLPLNKIWLEQQIKKERINKKWARFLEYVKDKLEFIYPDKWDIQLSLYEDFVGEYKTNYIGVKYFESYTEISWFFNIIIKFPEITITNSANEVHNIKDLYVNLPFVYSDEIDNFVIRGIYGRRGTYTRNEFLNSYGHSHLPFNNKEYTHFCLGDTETHTHLEQMIHNLDKLKFESLLFQLDNYVRWESLEGVPYHQISKIVSDEPISAINTSAIESYIGALRRYRSSQDIREYELEWKINNQQIELIDNETLDEYLKVAKDYQGFTDEAYGYIVVSRKANGDYVKYKASNGAITATTKPILFKGENHKVIVTGDTNSGNIYVHPKVKEIFKTKLQNEANNAVITNNRAKRINKFGYPKADT